MVQGKEPEVCSGFCKEAQNEDVGTCLGHLKTMSICPGQLLHLFCLFFLVLDLALLSCFPSLLALVA